MKRFNKLSCVVVSDKPQKGSDKDKGKKQWRKSVATISLGPLVVATGEWAGKVPNETLVMEEFKRNPHNKGRFKLNPDGYNAAKGLGLCG